MPSSSAAIAGMAPSQTPIESRTDGDRRELLLRIGSSAVILPIVAVADVMGGALFSLLVIVVGFGAMWEWTHLSGADTRMHKAIPAALVAIVVGAFAAGAPISVLAAAAGAAVASAAIASRRVIGVRPVSVSIGMLYVGCATAALIWLRSLPDGLVLVTLLLLVVMTTDICAYFAGRAIGGPKLFPAVSPKKTWSGAAGGLSCGIAVGWGLAAAFGASVLLAIALAALISVAAQIGDLIESWLKRRARVKDSGSIIPGHGGILDRLDGYLAASPVLAASVLLMDGVQIGWSPG